MGIIAWAFYLLYFAAIVGAIVAVVVLPRLLRRQREMLKRIERLEAHVRAGDGPSPGPRA